jgi:hypothetical protein
LLWSEQWRDNLRTALGFDRRRLTDELTDRTTDSNLVTAAVEYRPTEKIELLVKREQNLGESDPTYPNQTTFAANYKLNENAKLFFTQRLASAPITPIGDVSGTGFASTLARRETAFGSKRKFPILARSTLVIKSKTAQRRGQFRRRRSAKSLVCEQRIFRRNRIRARIFIKRRRKQFHERDVRRGVDSG